MASILILAGDSDGNLGDRAIVASTCREIRQLTPEVDIFVVSGRPSEDREYFQAETIARGPTGLPRLLLRALRSDGVLCGGGGLFQDDTSLIKMPYWALRLAAVRLMGGSITGFSLGVGPLDHWTSRFAARLAFAAMNRVSVRDRIAQELVTQLTRKPVELVPDPALGLSPRPAEEAAQLLEANDLNPNGRPLIGIALRQWFHHRPTWIPHKWAVKYGLRPVPGQEMSLAMCDLLAESLGEVAAQYDAHLLFLPTYNVEHEADDRTCLAVMERLGTANKTLLRIDDPRLYKAVTGHLSVMLASRMHASIFASAMGTPVVGLSYNPKFEGFFELIGSPGRVIRVDEFVERRMSNDLTQLLSDALDNCAPATAEIPELVSRTRAFLQEFVEEADSGS